MQWKAKLSVCVMIVVVMFGTGCKTRQPIEEALASAKKKALMSVLGMYGKRLREDDVQEIMKLVDPELSQAEKQRLKKKLSSAIWLRKYSGYTIDMHKTISSVDIEAFARPLLQIKIVASNSMGKKIVTPAVFRRCDSKWVIRDLSFPKPKENALMDLPEDEIRSVVGTVAPVMDALKEGETEKIKSMVPGNFDGCVRREEQNFLESLLGHSPQKYSLDDDLERLNQFHFQGWPDYEQAPAFVRVGRRNIMVVYEVSYAWPEGEMEEDTLDIRFFLDKEDGGWKMRKLRFNGRGLPGMK